MAEVSFPQSFQDSKLNCVQWTAGCGSDTSSGMSTSITAEGGPQRLSRSASSKRLSDGPAQVQSASKRRAIRDMSESFLNRICVRVAHSINRALAPGAEPLFRDQSSVVFPRFSQSSKSPHYDLASEARTPRRGERRVLFPHSVGAASAHGLSSSVDLTEPLFEDYSFNSDYAQSYGCIQRSGIDHIANNSKNAVHMRDANNNCVDDLYWVTSPHGLANSSPHEQDKDQVESQYCSTFSDSCWTEQAIGKLYPEILAKEPKRCPSTAFELFSSKVLPLLRLSEREALDAVKTSWDRLPSTEKYAFEMQRFALKDSYMKELLSFVRAMPEITRKVYLSHRRCEHEKFFGSDIFDLHGLAHDVNVGYPSDKLSPSRFVSPQKGNSSIYKNNCASPARSLHLSEKVDTLLPNHFESYFTSTQILCNNEQRLNIQFHTSPDHSRDFNNNNNLCTSLSDPAASLSSASSPWSDEDSYEFEDLFFVEEDTTQDIDSDSDGDSDGDSSQASTVTSVVMRPVRKGDC